MTGRPYFVKSAMAQSFGSGGCTARFLAGVWANANAEAAKVAAIRNFAGLLQRIVIIRLALTSRGLAI